MHSDARAFALTVAPSLNAVLRQLAAEPGRHTPFAGGTELMVALNTGRLAAGSYVSIQHLRELRYLHVRDDALHLGAGTTFTDLRRSQDVQAGWPLLAQAASWTGSVANQNRATIGGNVCNASPAADTPPMLLVFDAQVVLISVQGSRVLPYREFHLGYKRTALRPDELLQGIVVPKPSAEWHFYLRKVGTRQAQAISKTALACGARLERLRIMEIRLGAASLGDRPLRLCATEEALLGASVEANAIDTTVRLARAALAREAKPIDDIRSTAQYRAAVAGNLLEEFLRGLANVEAAG